MSADLQLRQELLEIRCPAMTIKINLSSSSAASSSTPDIVADRGRISIIHRSPVTPDRIAGQRSEEDCRTPKSPRNMIPKVVSCPPAPKKPTKAALSCKRKLCDFFESVGREEVESFFNQYEEKPNVHSIKRRCLV